MPPVIAVDLDEVLGSFISALCVFHNERYGTVLKQSDFSSYRFCEVWGGNDEEATEKVHEFFKTSHFENIQVIQGALEGLKQLCDLGFDLVVVTSRQLVIQEATKAWLAKHFPSNTFQQVVFGNHWGREGRKIKKVDLCKQLGASVLIDDSLSYCNEVAREGIRALLFDLHGGYNWNKSDEMLPDVTRVKSWQEVVDHLRA